jgi:hypothetical protein
MTGIKLRVWVPVLLLATFVAGAAFAAPKIELKTDKHDFGQAWEGEQLTNSFQIKNVGDEELVIENVKTS